MLHAVYQIKSQAVYCIQCKAFRKFNTTTALLVHDHSSSLLTGDIISITPGFRTSKTIHHVVSSIIALFGTPISERPLNVHQPPPTTNAFRSPRLPLPSKPQFRDLTPPRNRHRHFNIRLLQH
ncbi:hypothetical protein EAF04_001600 [Stromatinia cepivora]|nr:hypothetical protein EAF04_001600 [Stromatinia cepivora]